MTLDEAIDGLLNDHSIEDYIYNVRERSAETEYEEGQSSWDRPSVKHFAECCSTLRAHLTDASESHGDPADS